MLTVFPIEGYQSLIFNNQLFILKINKFKKTKDVYDPSHADFRDLAKEIKETMEWLGPNTSSKILDIGCGTGNFCIQMASICEKVYAIDVSENRLKFAQSKEIINGFINRQEQRRGDFMKADTIIHFKEEYSFKQKLGWP